MLKVGIVGLRRGAALLRVFAARPDCEIAVICDTDKERLEKFRVEHSIRVIVSDFSDLLNEPLDIVVIASPPHFHASQAIAALWANVHVMSEVYACETLDEASKLVRGVKNSRAKYMLAENCNFMYWAQEWQRMVRDGKLGKLTYMEAEYIHSLPLAMRNQDGSVTWRGTMPPIYYCTHSLGPLLALENDRCVMAVGMHTGCNTHPETQAIDQEVALFQTANGAVIKILCGFSVAREPSFHYYTVYGTRGSIERPRPDRPDIPTDRCLAYLADEGNGRSLTELPLGRDYPGESDDKRIGGHGTAEWFMIDSFVRSIVEGTPSPIDVYQALDMSLPGLCAHESAENGSVPIAVPNPRAL